MSKAVFACIFHNNIHIIIYLYIMENWYHIYVAMMHGMLLLCLFKYCM